MTAPMIALDRVSFAYGNHRPTIHDVDLRVAEGECVVLCGPSGGGKTTLIRLINGLAGGYYDGSLTGTIRLNGIEAVNLAPWQRTELVGSVFQDPASQFFSSQLAGEIAFTGENLGHDHASVIADTDAAIAAFGLDPLRDIPNDALSSGQKQRVAIASATAPHPRIVAMDEPSSNLDEAAATDLGRTIADLKARGYTLIIAEHRLAYLIDSVDRFHLVRGGRIERTLTREEVLDLSDDVRTSWGLRAPRTTERPALASPGRGDEGATPALRVDSVSAAFGGRRIFDDVSFTADSGQIVALTGDNGVGKTTLLRILAGLGRGRSGGVTVTGRKCSRRRRRKRIWHSPNDVKAEFFTDSVAHEVMLLIPPDEKHKVRARGLLRHLNLWDLKEQHPATLSGGQKQRLSIACALMSERPVLVLDEPTSGLDALNMRAVGEALRHAADEGKAVVVATHDNEFIANCCTHSYVLEPTRR